MEELYLVFVAGTVGLVAERERNPDFFEFAPREMALDCLGLDSVDAGAVQPEDFRLYFRGECRVDVFLLELVADLEGAEGLDLVLG